MHGANTPSLPHNFGTAAVSTPPLPNLNRGTSPIFMSSAYAIVPTALAHVDVNPLGEHGHALHIVRQPTVPRYGGHRIQAANGRAAFYKPNTHPQLHGERQDIAEFSPTGYLSLEDTKGAGKVIVSHRGLMDLHNLIPENSKASIQNAWDKGFRVFELDVMVTKDGVPVNFHDASLGRSCGDPLNRLVSDVTWAELQEMRIVIPDPANNGNYVVTDERIQSVEEVMRDALATKPGISIMWDVKEQLSESVVDLVLRNPKFNDMTAIKPYGRGYIGGFDQFLGNLHERYDINSNSDEDRGKRQALLDRLKQIKVVPIFSQVLLQNEDLLKLFPSKSPEGPRSMEGLTESAMGWLKSWQALEIKVIEAHSTGPDTLEGRAMTLLNAQLAAKGSGFSHIAMSASYRYEDFSVVQPDGVKKFYIYNDTGGMRDVTDDAIAAERETAGALRHDGEAALTDQPEEEVYATHHDLSLHRGHSGAEVVMPKGMKEIDLTRNQESVQLRAKEYEERKQVVQPEHVSAVRASRKEDLAAPNAAPSRTGNSGWWKALPWAVGAAAIAFVGARNRGALQRMTGATVSSLQNLDLNEVGGQLQRGVQSAVRSTRDALERRARPHVQQGWDPIPHIGIDHELDDLEQGRGT